jgi:hypothetical protein
MRTVGQADKRAGMKELLADFATSRMRLNPICYVLWWNLQVHRSTLPSYVTVESVRRTEGFRLTE